MVLVTSSLLLDLPCWLPDHRRMWGKPRQKVVPGNKAAACEATITNEAAHLKRAHSRLPVFLR